MTNLFPVESLNHFIDGDYSDKVKSKVKKILNAQVNYEFSQLQVSCWAKNRPECIVIENGKRVFSGVDKSYPFKQSSPYRLLELIGNRPVVVNNQLFGLFYILPYNICSIFGEFDSKWIFFCSKDYTKETGIAPCRGLLKEECLSMYIDYIKWKLGLDGLL